MGSKVLEGSSEDEGGLRVRLDFGLVRGNEVREEVFYGKDLVCQVQELGEVGALGLVAGESYLPIVRVEGDRRKGLVGEKCVGGLG